MIKGLVHFKMSIKMKSEKVCSTQN